MSHYILSEEQIYRLQTARLALYAVTLLVDDGRGGPLPSDEFAALLAIIRDAIPGEFRFVPASQAAGVAIRPPLR